MTPRRRRLRFYNSKTLSHGSGEVGKLSDHLAYRLAANSYGYDKFHTDDEGMGMKERDGDRNEYMEKASFSS